MLHILAYVQIETFFEMPTQERPVFKDMRLGL